MYIARNHSLFQGVLEYETLSSRPSIQVRKNEIKIRAQNNDLTQGKLNVTKSPVVKP